MKKSILIFAVLVAMVCFVQKVNAQTQTFNFKATVEKYIQVSAAELNVNLTGWNQTILNPGILGSEVLPGWPAWKARWADNVYANCPFTITYAGANGLPILSRPEVNGDIVDRLQTLIIIRNEINGVWANYATGHEVHDMKFVSDAEGANTGTYTNQTVTFNETPHNGEVQTEVWMSAALPHVSPDFGTANTANQSADAGTYSCQVVATYAAL